MNPEPTGFVMTPWGFEPVYADRFAEQPTWYYPSTPPAFSGNAHQRRIRLRRWLWGNA
jgi:hypothetical protein